MLSWRAEERERRERESEKEEGREFLRIKEDDIRHSPAAERKARRHRRRSPFSFALNDLRRLTSLPSFLNNNDDKKKNHFSWEAHVWVSDEGKQAYLGGYATEEEAAEAHDVAALKCQGPKARTNFPVTRYASLLSCLASVPLPELVMSTTVPPLTRASLRSAPDGDVT